MRMGLNRILGIIYPGDHLPSYMIDLRPRLVYSVGVLIINVQGNCSIVIPVVATGSPRW